MHSDFQTSYRKKTPNNQSEKRNILFAGEKCKYVSREREFQNESKLS